MPTTLIVEDIRGSDVGAMDPGFRRDDDHGRLVRKLSARGIRDPAGAVRRRSNSQPFRCAGSSC